MAACQSPDALEPQKSIVSSPLSNRSSQFKQGALKQRQMHSALQVSRVAGNKALFNMFFVSKRQQLEMKKKEAAREVRRALQEKKDRAKKEHEERGRELERKKNGISSMQDEYMKLIQQQSIAEQKSNDSSLRLPDLQGPTSSSGRLLVHSESPGSNRKKNNKMKPHRGSQAQHRVKKPKKQKRVAEECTESQEGSSLDQEDSGSSDEEEEEKKADRKIRVKSQAAISHKKKMKERNQYFPYDSSESYESDYEEERNQSEKESDTYVEDNLQLVKRDKRLKRELKKERREEKESQSFDSRRDLEKRLALRHGDLSYDSENPGYILRGPKGEILYQNQTSLGSSQFEEFKTEDLKDYKYFSTQGSNISAREFSEYIKTQREITGDKSFLRMDPHSGEMVRVEGEYQKNPGLQLPSILSPREESKKLKIKIPLSLKQRMQQKKASADARLSSGNYLTLNRKLYNNVEPRVFELRTPSEAVSLLDQFQQIRKSARKLKARSQARSPQPKKELNPLIKISPQTSMSGLLPQKSPAQQARAAFHPSQIVAPSRRQFNQYPSVDSPASSVSNRKSRDFSSSTNYSSSVDSLKSTPISRNNLQARRENPLYKRALERVQKNQQFISPFTYEPSSEEEQGYETPV